MAKLRWEIVANRDSMGLPRLQALETTPAKLPIRMLPRQRSVNFKVHQWCLHVVPRVELCVLMYTFLQFR